MKYLVMECHVGYAVVMDEEGRILKVANLNYQVGQTVTNVIQETVPIENNVKIHKINRWMKPLVPVAACFCFLIIMAWQMMFVPYGSVEIVINPNVLLQVNRMDKVIDVEGLNQDGMDLVETYEYKGKTVGQVSDELADRAVEMGYLTEGGTIHLIIDGKKEEWKVATEERLLIELEVHMGETYVIQIDEFREDAFDETYSEPNEEVANYVPGEYAGTILLSVNPEIEVDYDVNGRVIEVRGLNEAAKSLLAAQGNYSGYQCKNAIANLVDSIYKAGYFDETLDGQVKNIVIKLNAGSTYPSDDFLAAIAEAVKAAVANNKLDSSPMLVEEKDLDDNGYIGIERAKELVLAHLRVTDATFNDHEYELDDGVYEFELIANGIQYEYEVHASTGKILEADMENDDWSSKDKWNDWNEIHDGDDHDDDHDDDDDDHDDDDDDHDDDHDDDDDDD